MRSEIREALRSYSEGDWEQALRLLSDSDLSEGDFGDSAYLLGLCHVRLGNFDEALLYLEQVVTSEEDPARLYQCRMALAYIYAVTGRVKLAEYELSRLRDSGYESAQICAALGYTAWIQGNIDDSLHWYGRALDLEPSHPTSLNGLGYVLAYRGDDLTRALSCCRKAVEARPNNPAYQDSLGWVYLKLGFLDEAETWLERALKGAPEEKEIQEHVRALRELKTL
ncbi:MAG: tetratricopeptide repeat protein [Treponema sp.]|nr:tetratricopeptide repeat protein [Treponema sp.]